MYEFSAKVKVYPGIAAWYFATLPKSVAREIDFEYGHCKAGFGSLRVSVTIGQTTWQTSIFTNTKTGSYMLPIKAAVRRAESIDAGDTIHIELEIIV